MSYKSYEHLSLNVWLLINEVTIKFQAYFTFVKPIFAFSRGVRKLSPPDLPLAEHGSLTCMPA